MIGADIYSMLLLCVIHSNDSDKPSLPICTNKVSNGISCDYQNAETDNSDMFVAIVLLLVCTHKTQLAGAA